MNPVTKYTLPDLNDAETSLNFKDHKDFFEKFYELRTAYISAVMTFHRNAVEKELVNAVLSLLELIEWTASHLASKMDVEDLIDRVMQIPDEKIDLLNKKKKLDMLFHKISSAHEQCELIPKIQILQENQQAKFWKDEENSSMKNLKKAFFDYFHLSND